MQVGKLISIGAAVILTFGLVWSPFLILGPDACLQVVLQNLPFLYVLMSAAIFFKFYFDDCYSIIFFAFANGPGILYLIPCIWNGSFLLFVCPTYKAVIKTELSTFTYVQDSVVEPEPEPQEP